MMLDSVKTRCGIPDSITVYDNELLELIADAVEDMKTAGVPEDMLQDGAEVNPRALTAVALYVLANRGQDRSDTEIYMRLYKAKLHKLMLEPDTEEGE